MYVCMYVCARVYKEYLVLNCLQWLICNKTRPKQTKPNLLPPAVSK